MKGQPSLYNLMKRVEKLEKYKRNEYRKWNEVDENGNEVLCIQSNGKLVKWVFDWPDDDDDDDVISS